MRKFLLATGMLLTTMSAANAITTEPVIISGTGLFYGEFSSSGMDMLETDPTQYVENGGVYGESYSEYMMDGNSYRWGIWSDEMDPSGYGWSANNLSFEGNGFYDQAKGETFVAGTINYTNGVAFIGSSPNSVMLSIVSSSEFSGFSQQLFIDIVIDSSPNSDSNGNPLSEELAADYIYFPMFPEFGSLRVFEGESGSVEILAEFNSLHFKGFGEVLTPGTAFVSSSLTTIPVPAAVWFFGSGLLGLIGMRRRKNVG